MEEPADTEETSHPVVRRTPVAGHHGVRDGLVSVLGATRRVQLGHQIRAVPHRHPSVDPGLHTRVSRTRNVSSDISSNISSKILWPLSREITKIWWEGEEERATAFGHKPRNRLGKRHTCAWFRPDAPNTSWIVKIRKDKSYRPPKQSVLKTFPDNSCDGLVAVVADIITHTREKKT